MELQRYSGYGQRLSMRPDDDGLCYIRFDVDPILEAIEAIRWFNEADEFYISLVKQQMPSPREFKNIWVHAKGEREKAMDFLGIKRRGWTGNDVMEGDV